MTVCCFLWLMVLFPCIAQTLYVSYIGGKRLLLPKLEQPETSTSSRTYPFKIATEGGFTTFAELVAVKTEPTLNLICHESMFSKIDGNDKLPLMDLCLVMLRQCDEVLANKSLIISSSTCKLYSSASIPTSLKISQLDNSGQAPRNVDEQEISTCKPITIYSDGIESNEKLRFDQNAFMIQYSSKYSGEEIVNWVCEEGKTLGYVPRKLVHEFNLLHKGVGVMVFDEEQNVFVHQRASTKRIFPSMYDMFIGGISTAGESSGTTMIRELREELGIDLLLTGESDKDISYTYASKAYNEKVQERVNAYNDRGVLSWETAFDLAYENYKSTHFAHEKLRELEPSVSPGNRAAYIGNTICFTNYNHCFVDVYSVVIDEKTKSRVFFKDGEIQSGQWMSADALNLQLERERDFFVPDGILVFDSLLSIMSERQSKIRRN